MLFANNRYAQTNQPTMPVQTRSMTARAGVPHDLEAFNSYAQDDFDFHLPPKKRQRFLNWDEDSDDDDSDNSSFNPSHDSDDGEDSFELATGSSDSEFDPYEPPSMPTIDQVPHEIRAVFDPNHFCPSWVQCCEDNLALSCRWPERLTTWRARFTRSQWRDYIGEICHNISYENADGDALTTEEYKAAHDFMHGNL